MVRYRLLQPDPREVQDKLDGRQPAPLGNSTPHQPARIVELAVDVPPAIAYLDFPLHSTLLQLSVHNAEQRKQFVRLILEDENTRLLEMIVDPASKPDEPAYYLFIAKDMDLPGGERRTIRLPFRLTIEEVGTKGIWNKLRILANAAPDAAVVIRSKLLTEVAVTDDFSATDYETCITYSSSADAERRGKTVVTFAANMELTFYRHVTGRIRDVSFRGVVGSRSTSILERSKQQGVSRACTELTRQMTEASLAAGR
jgi:hypothetical protein